MLRDFFCEASLGLLQGRTNTNMFGYAPNVQTASLPITIWDAGIAYSYPTADETWEVVSSSALDTAAGTGARVIFITPINFAFAQQAGISVPLNGTTPVVISGLHAYNNFFTIVATGSGGSNAGNITLRVQGGGATRGFISIGKNQERRAMFTVPAGKALYIQSYEFLVAKSGGADVTVHITPFSKLSIGVRIALVEFTMNRSHVDFATGVGAAIPEKTTIEFSISDASANGADVSFGATGILNDLSSISQQLLPPPP